MAEAKPNPVKEEGREDDELNAPIAANPKAKPIKKEEPRASAAEDDDDDDNVPLAFSKGNIKKKLSNPSKVKKEELDGEVDEGTPKGLKGNTLKKEAVTSNGKPSKEKKEEPQEDEKEKTGKGKTLTKGGEKSNGKLSKVKKESDGKDEKDNKKKKKKKKGEEKKASGKGSKDAEAQAKNKKERKVYDFPGQKHDPPEERDPLRIFYETLYQQVPNSEMAAFWMMEWGLLPLEVAKKVYEKKLKKGQQQKLGSPVKVVSVKKTSSVSVKKVMKIRETVSKTPKKRKARDSESDDDDDFVLSTKIKKVASS